MPCNQHNDSHPCDWCPRNGDNQRRAQEDYAELKARLEAMLCAAMTTLVGLGEVDISEDVLKECGVTIDDINAWWQEHQREDRIRRYRERMIADLNRGKRKKKQKAPK